MNDLFLKIFGVAILIFAGVVAWMIGTRIDQETISLLSGTAIGILATAPCASLITYILVRRRDVAPQSQEVTQLKTSQWILPNLMEQQQRFELFVREEGYLEITDRSPHKYTPQFIVINDHFCRITPFYPVPQLEAHNGKRA